MQRWYFAIFWRFPHLPIAEKNVTFLTGAHKIHFHRKKISLFFNPLLNYAHFLQEQRLTHFGGLRIVRLLSRGVAQPG